jgi:hypothetical protein
VASISGTGRMPPRAPEAVQLRAAAAQAKSNCCGRGHVTFTGAEERRVTGICLCGTVSVTVEAKPDFINDCNCSLCRKAGAAWGYFPSSSVTTSGNTVPFVRRDKSSPSVEVHSCASCATTTHFVLTESFKERNREADLIGVNMRLFDPDELHGVEIRFPNGKDWPGEGSYEYRRPAMTISDAAPW